MALSAADLPTIYSLLSTSLSRDHSLRCPAESALSQCESRPGFCSCLMEVISAKDLSHQVDVRLMASVYFKNSINRYWRNRRYSIGISSDEKIHLRKRLLLHLHEENYQIAQQLAMLVSKIARIDYPKDWPDLFSSLGQQLQLADIMTSHRICMVLFRTLKELSTKRLTSDLKNFAEISSHLFEYSWHLWKSDVQSLLHNFSSLVKNLPVNISTEDELNLICERWLLCSRIIRQLIISGFQSDARSLQEVHPVKVVCPALLAAVQSFLLYYSSFDEKYPKIRNFVGRACIKLMKILAVIQSRHPYSFGDKTVLPFVLDFCLNKILNPEPEITSYEQFLIQCMVMVKSVLDCKEYKPSLIGRVIDDNGSTIEQTRNDVVKLIVEILRTLLPNERVVILCNALIKRYFVLTANDVEEWHRNPESFHLEQDMVQWTEKLRPCAEALYIVLFENYKELLGPVVLTVLHEAMEGCSPAETDISSEMLLKDAAYTAVGHVYYDLASYLNFNDWFNGALSFELSNKHPNMCVLHRKIAFVLGRWVPEIKGDLKKVVYCALLRLLQDSDLAVRLSASRSLCFLAEGTDFHQEGFSELLPTCWELCFKLLEEVQEFDSKVQVLNLISVLIVHSDGHMIPFANKLLGFFQKVWEDSIGESLLQIRLLEALRNFVSALGSQSPVCYDMLLPILHISVDINNPNELNLLEDGVLLWEATITNAPSMVSELLSLFPYLIGITERSFDHLKVVMDIVEGYTILGGIEFLKMHSSTLSSLLDGIVGNVNDKGHLSTFPIIETLIQCFPNEAPPIISASLQKLIVICLDGEDEREPYKTAVKAYAGAILARLLVMNSNYLAHLTGEPALTLALQQSGVLLDQKIILCLADFWLDKADNVDGLHKKAYALALSIILTLREPQILDKLDQILSVCTSAILMGIEDNSWVQSSENASSLTSDNGGGLFELTSCKEFRKRQLRTSDPIKELSLEFHLGENLKAFTALHGEASLNSAIGKIHPSMLPQLQVDAFASESYAVYWPSTSVWLSHLKIFAWVGRCLGNWEFVDIISIVSPVCKYQIAGIGL